MKRFISCFLVTILLMIVLPAMAENVRTSGDFQYTVKGNGTATIVGFSGAAEDLILPNYIDGYMITSIGDSAFCSHKLMMYAGINVTIPNTITSIGEKAFFNVRINTINLPDSLEYIGYGAFAGNKECEFRISNNHPYFAVIDGALYNKAKKELICGYTYAEIPEGIVSIGDYACYGGTLCGISSKGISLPSTIKRIGNYSYYKGSYSYEKDVIHQFPEGLTYIGDYAFADSYFSMEFQFPASIEHIGESAFRLGDFGHGAKFRFSPATNLGIVENYAFYNSDAMIEENTRHSIFFDGSIEEYGEYAFTGSHIYGSLNGVQAIGNHAFEKCSFDSIVQKSGLVIPGSCRTIGEYAFAYCNDVGAIILENGIESIGQQAFFMLKKEPYFDLKAEDTYLPASLNSIALDAFDRTATYVVEKGTYAERWVRDNAFPYTINGEEQNLDWLNN